LDQAQAWALNVVLGPAYGLDPKGNDVFSRSLRMNGLAGENDFVGR